MEKFLISIFALGISLLILFVLWVLITIPSAIVGNLSWTREVESYFQLSDQASTPQKKLEYLTQYREEIRKYNLCDGNARYIFTTPRTNMKANCDILDTLISRLDDLTKMNPDSMQYQQAMQQVTKDEYAGFDSCMFMDRWNRENLIRFIFAGGWTCQDGMPPTPQS